MGLISANSPSSVLRLIPINRITINRSRLVLRTRIFTALVALFVLWNALDVWSAYYHIHFKPATESCPSSLRTEKVFISTLQFNSAPLLRSHWSKAILDLSKELGPSNVYFSAYESASTDDTQLALLELDHELEKLGVARTIVTGGWSHSAEIAADAAGSSWLQTPNGTVVFRRIPFLARMRNYALAPLEKLVAQGQHFDKILFLNDIVFTAEDALNVLDTNDGDYAAACSLDFEVNYPSFYDSFALLDSNGDQFATWEWPYFGSAKSRHALLKRKPVPVRSCWNGLAAFDAAPFMTQNDPLRFRSIPNSLAQYHVEASECCLIHIDNPLSSKKGIYLNPNVHVGYAPAVYAAVQTLDEEMTPLEIFGALWRNRGRRWFVMPYSASKNHQHVVPPRVRAWERMSPEHHEAGAICLIDEMQVLTDHGWTYVIDQKR